MIENTALTWQQHDDGHYYSGSFSICPVFCEKGNIRGYTAWWFGKKRVLPAGKLDSLERAKGACELFNRDLERWANCD